MLDGHYTHASDVWAFGILAWELYTSFTTEQDGRDLSVPFFNLEKHEVNSRASAFQSRFNSGKSLIMILLLLRETTFSGRERLRVS